VDENQRATGGPVEQTEDTARQLFYAWLGALATAYDTAEDRYDQFVRRGREVTEEWQNRSDDARRASSRTSGRVRDSFRMMMDGVMSGMNMPTKSEVDAMNVKLNILMRKLDDLAMRETISRPGQPEAPPPFAPRPDTDMAT
jgi:polyhydroxyalkanoate synthesis regulator phasin